MTYEERRDDIVDRIHVSGGGGHFGLYHGEYAAVQRTPCTCAEWWNRDAILLASQRDAKAEMLRNPDIICAGHNPPDHLDWYCANVFGATRYCPYCGKERRAVHTEVAK